MWTLSFRYNVQGTYIRNKTYVVHFEFLLKYEWKPKIEITRHSVESFSHKMNETSCTIWCKKNFFTHALCMILPIWWVLYRMSQRIFLIRINLELCDFLVYFRNLVCNFSDTIMHLSILIMLTNCIFAKHISLRWRNWALNFSCRIAFYCYFRLSTKLKCVIIAKFYIYWTLHIEKLYITSNLIAYNVYS